MSKLNLDGPSFGAVEKDLYVEPPTLPYDASEEEKLKAWQQWQEEDAKRRRAHKAAYTRKNKGAPEVQIQSTVKRNGVYKQQAGASGLEGSSEDDTIEQVAVVQATQDRHFQPRGTRAGDKSKSKARQRSRNRRAKTHKLLSQRNKT